MRSKHSWSAHGRPTCTSFTLCRAARLALDPSHQRLVAPAGRNDELGPGRLERARPVLDEPHQGRAGKEVGKELRSPIDEMLAFEGPAQRLRERQDLPVVPSLVAEHEPSAWRCSARARSRSRSLAPPAGQARPRLMSINRITPSQSCRPCLGSTRSDPVGRGARLASPHGAERRRAPSPRRRCALRGQRLLAHSHCSGASRIQSSKSSFT